MGRVDSEQALRLLEDGDSDAALEMLHEVPPPRNPTSGIPLALQQIRPMLFGCCGGGLTLQCAVSSR